MLANYFLVALYNLRRQPMYAAAKVLSLAIGLGCGMLVIMHVQYAFSFDRHFANWQNTYRVVTSLTLDSRMHTEYTSDAVALRLRQQYPQVAHMAMLLDQTGLFTRGEVSSVNPYFFADAEFLKVFAPEFIAGDPVAALDAPNAVVLDETTARKYFGNGAVLGQTLTLRDIDLTVTGLIRDLPKNTHMHFQMLVSTATARAGVRDDFMSGNDWSLGVFAYVTVPDKAAADAINADLPAFLERNLPEAEKEYARRTDMALALEPLGDVYLSPRRAFGETTNNRGRIMGALALFAALILLTSCINFVNLSVAQVRERGREIGLRKTLGAKRRDIVLQFQVEALLLAVLALCLTLPLLWLAVPPYAALTATDFTLADALNARTLLALGGFVLVTALLSGLFPALGMARHDPAVIIKGAGHTGRDARLARSGITVVQFGFSTALILFAVAVTLQIRHLNTMDLGFNKDDLLLLESRARGPEEMDALVNELGRHPGVAAVAKVFRLPPNALAKSAWRLPADPPEAGREVSHLMVDVNYFDAMQLRLLAGRWFSRDFPADFMVIGRDAVQPPLLGMVITRTAAQVFGLGSPQEALGKQLVDNRGTWQVIGVVEDFHMRGGLEDPLNSIMVVYATQSPVLSSMLLRIDPAQADAALAHIDAVWERHRPELPSDRRFYRQTYGALVDAETRGINVAALFASVISVVISAFGLYALALHSTQRRTKEVGIRKVLGATSRKVARLLTWDFLKPVLVACVLASAGGYYAIEYYFRLFTSRADVSPLAYLGVTALTLLVAILTVASRCWRAANADPVKSLHYE